MAGNTFTFTGQYQVAIPTGNINNYVTIQNNAVGATTGSNYVSQQGTFASGSIVALSATASLGGNIRYMIFDNTGTGSIAIGTNAAMTNVITYLAAGDNAAIPWSGSNTPLYAQALNQSGTTFTYVIITW